MAPPKAANGETVEKDVFYVKDNGVGIPVECHDEIFRMFKRLHASQASEAYGTGAGLAFVKRIVERHGDHICLASAPSEGTTFYFTLPQAPDNS